MEIFNVKFYTPVLCSYLCVITTFFQSSVTSTKLYHLKYDHLVNFYISLEKTPKMS